MNKCIRVFNYSFLLFLISKTLFAQVNYQVKHVESMPIIDGISSDLQWKGTSEV